jgi:hypothetical protein
MATPAAARERDADRGVAGDCPRCGAPYAPLQEYCLECGLRLPEEALPAPPRGAFARLPAEGAWVWPALVGLVVAVLAVAAIVIARATDEPAEEVLVATPGAPPFVPPTTEEAEVPAQPIPTLPAPRTQPRRRTGPPPPPSPRPGDLVSWPAGRGGWTVVLASYPESTGRETAVSRAREASEAGVRDVGVVDSSEHASLHPGYFVVFAGIHDSEEEAQNTLEQVQSQGYDAAYVREISSSR